LANHPDAQHKPGVIVQKRRRDEKVYVQWLVFFSFCFCSIKKLKELSWK
jgi:hypothetical protein